MSLPTDAKARKDLPIYSGVVAYFPLAIAAVAELSRKGNDQHNPGKPLHWDRSKSGDETDALMRHLLDHAAGNPVDSDGVLHLTKVAWRALAALQKELEKQPETGPVDDNPWRSWDGRSTVPPCDPYITVEVWFAGSDRPSTAIWHASTWCWKWSGSRPRSSTGDIVAWRPYKAPTQDGQS